MNASHAPSAARLSAPDWRRRALAATAAKLTVRHPHARILHALIWDGALAVETAAADAPARIDLRTLIQLDGDAVTAVSPEALATPAVCRAALDRHGRALARCRKALRSELDEVFASLGHLWIAGAAAFAILASQTAPLQAMLVAACGPALRLGWRRAKVLLLRRTIRHFAERLAYELRPAPSENRGGRR